MPIRSGELASASHKTRPQDQDSDFQRSIVSNRRPNGTMLKGTGCSPSGKAAFREEARRRVQGRNTPSRWVASDKESHNHSYGPKMGSISKQKGGCIEAEEHLTLKKAMP